MAVKKAVAKKEVVAQIENKKLIEKKHRQIIKAAGKLFSKKGYHTTTMRDISKASGINLSYLYKYVSSKDDILYLFYRALGQRSAPIYQSLNDSPDEDPVKQLKAFIRYSFNTVRKYGDEFLTMYTESRHLERDSLHAVLSTESEMVRCLEKLIIRGVERGCFKTRDPFMAANIIQLLTVLEPLRGWNFRDRYDFDRLLESVTGFIMGSLGVRE